MQKFISTLLFVIFCMSFGFAQGGSLKDYSQYVQTLDQTIETLYAVISGPKGEKRDWELFKYLFQEDAKLIPVRKDQNGLLATQYWSPDEYVKRAGSFLEQSGFFEKEIHRVTESFGPVTHVFSTYESYRKADEVEPFARGINSIQLMHDADRWWIINIYWAAEGDENPIPKEYLPRKD